MPLDPAGMPPDAGLVFIGRIASPWRERSECPKNMARAREAGRPARIQLAENYRDGLEGLSAGSGAILLTWLDRAARNLAVQKPRHAETPRGVFALRSPVRPNPVGVHVVRIVAVDRTAGILDIDAIDVLDGTPLLDIKPWFATTDIPPDGEA